MFALRVRSWLFPLRVPALSFSHFKMAGVADPYDGRGNGYGLDADLAKKRLEALGALPEDEAIAYVEATTGISKPEGTTMGSWLRNGEVLCELANALSPGSVKTIERDCSPFKQMENISNFIKVARGLGCPGLFETVDLYEQRDLVLVVQCLVGLKKHLAEQAAPPTAQRPPRSGSPR